VARKVAASTGLLKRGSSSLSRHRAVEYRRQVPCRCRCGAALADDFDMGASLSSTMSSSSKAIPQPLRRKRTQAARQRQPTVLWFARRTVAASTVVFNAPDVSGLGTVFPVFKWVNYAARSNSPSIAHLPRDHSIFRDPRCRKACPCRKRICREPSPTHERNQISRHIP
jgi:hypothetical protein